MSNATNTTDRAVPTNRFATAINLSITGMLFILSGCGAEKHAGTSITQPGKPNVLFILTDDQRADALGCSGNPVIKTPNIDGLAASGVRFSNCYIMGSHHGAVCAPSRAMLMSGKSMFHVDDNLTGVKTLPMYFGEYGYETFGTGKWHNQAESFKASFQAGRNIFLGGMSNHFHVPCHDMLPDMELTDPMNKGFSTDIFTEAAIEFLRDYSTGPRTNLFFCYLAFTAPHDPRSPREDYTGMYPEDNITVPANFKELHPFEFDDLNIRDETLAPWPRTKEHIKATLADYYALISHIDKRTGDIIDFLKTSGLYDNTIIVFSSDNGLAAGSHGLLGKQNLYEHSTKVPLIITGPGIPEGRETDALAYLYDLFPTLAGLCGLPQPKDIDGENLTPVIRGKENGVRNSVYTAYRNSARALRTDNWKLIWYLQRKHIQLFNLNHDPHEITNLAGDTSNKKRIEDMMKQISEWHKFTGDTAVLYPAITLPMEYDYTKLKQIPDQFQPPYVLKRFFPEKMNLTPN